MHFETDVKWEMPNDGFVHYENVCRPNFETEAGLVNLDDFVEDCKIEHTAYLECYKEFEPKLRKVKNKMKVNLLFH